MLRSLGNLRELGVNFRRVRATGHPIPQVGYLVTDYFFDSARVKD